MTRLDWQVGASLLLLSVAAITLRNIGRALSRGRIG